MRGKCVSQLRVISGSCVVKTGLWFCCFSACAFGVVARVFGGVLWCVVVESVSFLGFERRGVTRVAQPGSRRDLPPAVVGRHSAPFGRAVLVSAVSSVVTEVASFLAGAVEDNAGAGSGGGSVGGGVGALRDERQRFVVELGLQSGITSAAERRSELNSAPFRDKGLSFVGGPLAVLAGPRRIDRPLFGQSLCEQDEIRLPTRFSLADHSERTIDIDLTVLAEFPKPTHDDRADLVDILDGDGALDARCSDLPVKAPALDVWGVPSEAVPAVLGAVDVKLAPLGDRVYTGSQVFEPVV